MPWSHRSIEDAIQTCKSNNGIFVIYIEDETRTTSLGRIINNPEIENLLRSNRFVAIRISGSSQSYRDFVSIYHMVPIPSLFFIGPNGWPLEIITEELTEDDIVYRIKKLLCQYEQGGTSGNENSLHPRITITVTAPTSSSSSGSIESCEAQSVEVLSREGISQELSEEKPLDVPSEKSLNEKSDDISEHANASDNIPVAYQGEECSVSQHVPKPVVEAGSGLSRPVSTEQTINRQSAEVYHVPVPGILMTLGGWMRSVLNATPNKAQTTGIQGRDSTNLEHMLSRSSPFPTHGASTSEFGAAENAHIQFRLPDGSTRSQIFMATATISDVREYVRNNIPLPFREFHLSTSYPRAEFNEEHLSSTLGELSLVPRSVILIIPDLETPQSAYLSAATSAIWSLVAWPFTAIYTAITYLNLWILGGNDPAVDQGVAQQSQEQSTQAQNTASRNTVGVRRRMPSTSSSSLQQDGNIFRLSNRQEDSDDENNTWNGNSTQQM